MDIESNQDAEFNEFVAAGEVEDANADADGIEESDAGKKPARRGPPKEKAVEKPAAGGDDDADDDGDEGDEDDDQPKPKKTAAEHQIERLKREKRDLQRQLREGSGSTEMSRRLENLERGLPSGNRGDNQDTGKAAPDPSDADKYPLGHLDDRYIEDKLEWLAENKATKQADSVLQRQQEIERNAEVNAQQQVLLGLVDDLSSKGSDLFEDFQETVVEAGMRGDYDLQQPTFEACTEAANGAQILYELSQDTKEARRVAKLTPYGQLKFVQERDLEIGTGKRGRTKPGAGVPPKNQSKGANSKTQINPATNSLVDFEKAWAREGEKSR